MRTLLLECGAAQTRAALLHNKEVIRFFFAPARGDEKLPRMAQLGDTYFGRVRTVSQSIRGAFIDIGDGEDAFLPLTDKIKTPIEGAKIVVRVRRQAIGGKGAVLTADWTKGMPKGEAATIEAKSKMVSPPARLNTPADPVLEIVKAAGPNLDLVRVDDGSVVALLKKNETFDVELVDFPFETNDADDALDDALQPTTTLLGGGRLIFDETAGGCMIDIDGAGAVGASSTLLNDRVNTAAAQVLRLHLGRRSIGGRVIVDFLPPSTKMARHDLFKNLKRDVVGPLAGRAGTISKDGLFDMTIPRRQASLLDQASEPVSESLLRPGRVFTCDWIARHALRRLEAALKRAPSSRPRMLLSPELDTYLADHPQWIDRLAHRYGARFLIETADTNKGRTYDLAE